MSIVDSIYRGSYKGLLLVFEESSTKGGRKHSKKEYPNRDDQNIQDLGLLPRAYNLTIVVNAATPDAYFAERDAILRVLETKGPGELVHPLYGRIPNMAVLEWEMTEESSTLGEGKLVVLFEPDSDNGIPVNAEQSLSGVINVLADTNSIVGATFADTYKPDNSLFGVAQAALDSTRGFVDNVRRSTAFVGETTAQASGLVTQLTDIIASVNSLIQSPNQLSTTMMNVFETMWNIFDSEGDSFKSFENMFDAGANDLKYNYDTPTIRAININNGAFALFTNCNALTGAYKAAVQLETATVSDIDDISARLDNQYEIILHDPNIDVEVKNAIIDARVAVVEYLNVQRLTAAELVPVYVQETSSRLISFSYYNTSTRGTEIVKTNSKPDLNFIKGEIQILSE